MNNENKDPFFDAFANADISDIDFDTFNVHSDLIGTDRIHEAKPYNESEIFEISDEYYKTKGILAWSNKASKIIPHKIGTNYQSALAFAKLIKANLKNYSWNERVNILECGAGSGRFSRHLLYAFRELDIASKCCLLISDYSKTNLAEISASGILDEFEEDSDYKIVEFDIVSDNRATTLAGKRFNFSNLGAVFMHYVLDALPLTILRNQADKIEELYLTIHRRKDQVYDVIENDFLQARLDLHEEWRPYEFKQQSEPERYYKEHLLQYYKHSKSDIYYCYSALRAIDNLNRLLDDRAFILSSDILPNQNRRYVIVGNSVAHEIDNDFILDYQKQQGNYGTVINEPDKNLGRLLISKSEKVFETLEPVMQEVYVFDNQITKYLQMEKALEHLIKGNDANSLLMLLREFTKLAPYCSSTYRFWSEYYRMIKKANYSMEALAKAKTMDYWQDL